MTVNKHFLGNAVTKSGSWISLVLYLALTSTLNAQDTPKRHYIMSSGPTETPYHDTGKLATRWLNKSLHDNIIVHNSSTGSIENLQRLRDGLSDIIFVQRDILSEAFHNKSDPFGNIEIVMPLFPESLQIFVHGKPGLMSFKEFRERLASGAIQKIAIGPEGTTTHETTRQLLSILNVNLPDERFDTRSPTLYMKALSEGRIDAAAFFSAAPIPALSDKDFDQISMVSLNPSELGNATMHLRKLDHIQLDGEVYPFLSEDDKVHVLGTWAFMVAQKSTLEELKSSGELPMTKILMDNLMRNHHSDKQIHYTYASNGPLPMAKKNGEWTVMPDKMPANFLRGVPACTHLQVLLGGTRLFALYVFLVPVLLLVTASVWLKKRHGHVCRSLWLRYQHIFYGAVAFFLVALIIPYLIFTIEGRFCANNAIDNPILNLSAWERYSWLFILSISGQNDGLFPVSPWAKILASTSIYLNYSVVIAATLHTIIKERMRYKKRQGIMKYDCEKHIVICGWNCNAESLIKNMLREADVLNNKLMILLVTADAEISKWGDTLSAALEAGRVGFVKGEPRERDILIKCNITKAKTVVLLAEDNSQSSDERTLLRALAISRHCRNDGGNQRGQSLLNSIYIIAELNNPELKRSLIENDVNEVVCSKEMGSNIILQSAFYHGISKILHNLLTYSDDTNEFYTIDLREESNAVLRDKTFDELSPKLREKGMLLLGIKAAIYDGGREIIDEEEIARLLSEGGNMLQGMTLKRQIMINPTETEKAYKTDNDDQLFLLAMQPEVLSSVKDITFA